MLFRTLHAEKDLFFMDNNTFELYPNEEKFYKALIEWIQFNMKSTALGDIDVSPSSPNIDKISQIYLEELAKLLYVKHWYHNLNVPIFAPEDEDDMEDLIRDLQHLHIMMQGIVNLSCIPTYLPAHKHHKASTNLS